MQQIFASVISIIESDLLPPVLRHALVGEARIVCREPRHAIFREPLALDMMVDIMYDRGFSVCAEGKHASRLEQEQMHSDACRNACAHACQPHA